MPGKSRHGKGKHRHQSKKSKTMRRQVATAVTPEATGTPAAAPPKAPPTAAAPSARVAPPPKAARTTAKAMAIDYSYVTGELKRIGIMAGIAIVILLVLSVFIS
jgi:hypothetical protein